MSSRRDLYIELCEHLETEDRHPRLRFSDISQIAQALLPGDVLLVDGRNTVSRCLGAISNSRWSKVALYLGRPHELPGCTLRATLSEFVATRPDSQLVITSDLRRGLKVQHLDELNSLHLRICRPRNLTLHQRDAVIEHLVGQLRLSTPRSWFTLALIALPWSWVPHRWRLGLARLLSGQPFRTLSGTPIGEAFVQAHYPVLPLLKRQEKNRVRLYNRQPGIFFAADFDHSPYFDVMKFPFVDTDESLAMPLQPWSQQDGLESDTPPVRAKQDAV